MQKNNYRNIWKNSNNQYYKVATYALSALMANHVASMLDALLLAKKWNNEHEVKLSLNTYPDLRNKSGVGGVKLSLRWK